MNKDSLYTLNKYLFDIENYIALGIDCDIILTKSIWSSIFKDCGDGIWQSMSNEYDISVQFNNSAITNDKVIHFLRKNRKTKEYSSETYTLSDVTVNKIREFERDVKIDELLNVK